MSRAALYDSVGGPQVLYVANVEGAVPGPGQVVVAVAAAGVNPYDDKVREGLISSSAPFPRRIGGDLAGTVTSVGPDAIYWDGTPTQVGDRVLGSGTGSIAEQSVAKAANLARLPEGMDAQVAAGLPVPGLTAVSILDAVPLGPSDTVLVGGATGAVGMLVCQLARSAGAKVIGTAAERNHEFLRALGVEPVLYGPNLAERIDEPITAVMDCHGREALDAGVALGVPTERMVAIAAYDALEELGVQGAGYAVRTPQNLEALAREVAAGDLVFPVVLSFSLDETAQAFAALRGRHAPGKIVVVP